MRYLIVALIFMITSCGSGTAVSQGLAESRGKADIVDKEGSLSRSRSLVLGGGCFWCLEAAYEIVPGVLDVESGYAGGSRAEPSYEQVSAGLTGHAEVVRVVYDPAVVSTRSLFELFFRIHDPTTEDRQGADVGTQYRSIVLYADEEQKADAEAAIGLAQAGFREPIVTDVVALERFWPAEAYHQDFFRKNPDYGYCRAVVAPKVKKTRIFVDALP